VLTYDLSMLPAAADALPMVANELILVGVPRRDPRDAGAPFAYPDGDE
jgi:hypothetical protein